jgi:hypothetical protein
MRTRLVSVLLVSMAFLVTSRARGQSSAHSAEGGSSVPPSHSSGSQPSSPPPSNAVMCTVDPTKICFYTEDASPDSDSGDSAPSAGSDSETGAPSSDYSGAGMADVDPEAAERAAESRRADAEAEEWSKVEEMVDKDRALAAQPDQYDVIQDFKEDMTQSAANLVAADSAPSSSNPTQLAFPPNSASIQYAIPSSGSAEDDATEPPSQQSAFKKIYDEATDGISEIKKDAANWIANQTPEHVDSFIDGLSESVIRRADPEHVIISAKPVTNPDEATPEDILQIPPSPLRQGLAVVIGGLVQVREAAATQVSSLGSYLKDTAVGVAVNATAGFMDNERASLICGSADTPEGGECQVEDAARQINPDLVHYGLNLLNKFGNYFNRMTGLSQEE